MANTISPEILNLQPGFNESTINQWFEDNGFQLIHFQTNRYEIFTDEIYHTIVKNDNFKTYYKEDILGSLLVFEIQMKHNRLAFISYCPITLFGIFRRKVSFKENSPWISKYRQHGYEYLTAFKTYLKNQNPTR